MDGRYEQIIRTQGRISNERSTANDRAYALFRVLSERATWFSPPGQGAKVVSRAGSNIALHKGFRSHAPLREERVTLIATEISLPGLQAGGSPVLVRSQYRIPGATLNGLTVPRFGKKIAAIMSPLTSKRCAITT
jgi:hypothetical protein